MSGARRYGTTVCRHNKELACCREPGCPFESAVRQVARRVYAECEQICRDDDESRVYGTGHQLAEAIAERCAQELDDG